MNIQDIIAEIDGELARLRRVKALLSDTSTTQDREARPLVTASRPGGSKPRRTVSAAARKKMAAAPKSAFGRNPRKTAKHAAPSAVSSVNRKGRYGRLACKTAKKRSMSAGARCPDRCRPKSPLGESAEGRKKKRLRRRLQSKPVSAKKDVSAVRARASKTKGFYCSGFFSRTSSLQVSEGSSGA